MKTLRSWILFFCICAIGWQMISLAVDNSILCPSPVAVAKEMVRLTEESSFWQAAACSAGRSLLAAVLSFAAGIMMAVAAFFFRWAAWFLNKLVVILQSIPNVAYIILILFWTSRNTAVVLVCFLLLFPIVYRDFYEEFKGMEKKWKDVFCIYPQPWYVLVAKVFFPQLRPVTLSCSQSVLSLSFKSCIMAEILASVSIGMGRSIQSARLNIDVTRVMAWVVWLILLVFLFEWILRKILEYIFDK